MSSVINVNFKTKERLSNYKTKSMECEVCGNFFVYDSRYPEKRPIIIKNKREYFCFSCVTDMYNILSLEYNELQKSNREKGQESREI